MVYVKHRYGNSGKLMSEKDQDKDATPEDLAGLAGDLLTGIAAEPVPHHLVALAQQLQAALERKASTGSEAAEATDLG